MILNVSDISREGEAEIKEKSEKTCKLGSSIAINEKPKALMSIWTGTEKSFRCFYQVFNKTKPINLK